jgi:3-hydroxybutyryl-CoA dehydratase
MTIEELREGQQASFGKTISESDVYLFAGVTGDTNPAHINEVYAQGTRFKRRIAHGMMTAGLISAVLGVKMPGPGTIYLNQTLAFRAPVYFGDTITAVATVIELDREKNRVRLETVCVNQDGKTVTTGEALVISPTDNGENPN